MCVSLDASAAWVRQYPSRFYFCIGKALLSFLESNVLKDLLSNFFASLLSFTSLISSYRIDRTETFEPSRKVCGKCKSPAPVW